MRGLRGLDRGKMGEAGKIEGEMSEGKTEKRKEIEKLRGEKTELREAGR